MAGRGATANLNDDLRVMRAISALRPTKQLRAPPKNLQIRKFELVRLGSCRSEFRHRTGTESFRGSLSTRNRRDCVAASERMKLCEKFIAAVSVAVICGGFNIRL
jgi:hypothetical protein